MIAAVDIISIILSFAIMAFSAWCWVRIAHRAGFNPLWGLVVFVPVANIVFLWMFAFTKWPILSEETRTGSSARIQGDDYVSGGTIVDRDHRPETLLQTGSATVAEMRWMLAGFDGDGHAVRLEFALEDAKRDEGLIVGRNAKQCDLVLADAGVSRRHARLFFLDDKLHVEDLGSANGTVVGGRTLGGGEAAALEDGMDVAFGETRLRMTNA